MSGLERTVARLLMKANSQRVKGQRNDETGELLAEFDAKDLPLLAVPPTSHRLTAAIIYAL